MSRRLFWLLLVWFLAACTQSAPQEAVGAAVSESAAATLSPTPSPLPPTATPSGTPSPSPSATDAPTSTATVTPSPTADPCWSAGGSITRHSLSTDLSPLPWEFRVYTPPCYEQQTERRYPLLVLIHGSTYTDSQWDDLGADETADELIASGEAPPFIILMPRDRVWTEPEEDPFGEAVVTRIIPWIDENYRTLPAREFRAIGGLSRGASWSVHLGLKYWPQFSAIGAHSLPMFVNDPARIRTWLDSIPTGMLPRIYIDIGDKDYLLDKALWFENLLTEMNIPHEWYLNSGRHEDAYWAERIEDYLRWYADGW